jgi:signal transduction histidine kinase
MLTPVVEKGIFGSIALLTAFSTLGLAYFVRRNAPSSPKVRLYCLWALSVFLWSAFLTWGVFAPTPEMGLLTTRLLHAAAVMIPPLYLHFVLVFLEKSASRRRLIVVSYTAALVLETLIWGGAFVGNGYLEHFDFFISRPLEFYPLHPAIFALTVVYSCAELTGKLRREKDPQRRSEIHTFLAATIIGYSGGFTNYLVNYDVKIFPLYPFGNLTILVYVALIGLLILRHRFLGIDLAIRRTIIYSALTAGVSIVYIASVFGANRLLAGGLSLGNSYLSFYAVPPLLGTVAFAFLGVMVLLSRPRITPKLIFSVLCMETFFWQFIWFISFLVKPDADQLLTYLAKSAYLAITLIPFTFYHFIVSYLGIQKENRYVLMFYSVALGLIALLPTDLFVGGNRQFDWGHFTLPGPLYPLFTAMTLLSMVRGLIILSRAAFNDGAADCVLRNKIRYLLFAFVLYFFCTLDFFQVYGLPWYPTASFFFLMSAAIISYAITRHALLDIKIIVQKTLVYSGLTLLVSVLYVVTVSTLNQSFAVGFSDKPWFASLFEPEVMLHHNFLAAVITSASCSLLAGLVLWRGKKQTTEIAFALYVAAIALWSGPSALAIVSEDSHTALVLWRISHVGVIFIPVFFVHFVISLLNSELRARRKVLVFAAYAYGIVFLLANAAGHLITEMAPNLYLKNVLIYPPPLLYRVFFGAWLAWAAYGILELFALCVRSGPARKNQLSYFCLATLLAYLGGGANFLPALGILVPILVPYGTYMLPVYVGIATYAILGHRLIDIRVVIRKTLVYFILALFISLVYIALVFAIHRLFVDASASPFPVLPSVVSLLLIAILFKPIEVQVLRFLDRQFFKGTISEIAEEKEKLRTELERRERLKSVGILASGMAHEIRNPLAAINTFVEYLPQKYDDPKFREDFQRILKTEVGRIKGIVQDLLDFSKPHPLEKAHADLNQIVRDVLGLLSKDFLAHRIKAAFGEDERAGDVLIDPGRMKQALLNLIMNAIDAMKERGGELHVSTGVSNGAVRITVRDTGCGIAPDKLPRIFDPFFTEKDSGTGLGLAITHSIIDQHGGRIEVDSTAGKGTEFRIRLPLK